MAEVSGILTKNLILLTRRLRLRFKPIQIIAFVILVLIVIIALFAPFIAPYSPIETHPVDRLHPCSAKYILGTDQLGRDVLSRIIFGTRASLIVGLTSVSIAFLLGVILGAIAGFWGGKVDNIIMRFMDILFAFPGIILAVAMVAFLGASLLNVIEVIAVVFMAQFARIARASVLIEKEKDYVLAQKSLGASDIQILFYDILRNTLSPLIAQFTFLVASAILLEAGLGFLGLGVPPPTPSWGNILSSGREYLYAGAWWLTLFPGLAIFLTVFSLNIVGDTIRDFVDPRTRKELEGIGV